jgi:hypothetical protein
MKDMINEKILQLAAAQESMVNVAISIDQWEQSQLMLEKSAFETMNTADTMLNLSKQGNIFVDELYDHVYTGMKHVDSEKAEQVRVLIGDLHKLFHQFLEKAESANETAHDLEVEVATQREIGENMQKSISSISETIDAAVACAEFILAEI